MNIKSNIICGIDEAGRGPLAGPVFAGAVIIPADFDVSGLADSKKLSERKRETLAKKIFSECLFGVGVATVKEIDEQNILQAAMLAMERAYYSVAKKLTGLAGCDTIHCIVDGNKKPNIPNCEALVKADAKVPEVMAASIIAKVLRDRLMSAYGKKFPDYGFEKHKGYCTKAHLEAIYRFGESPIQRKSFTYPGKKDLYTF